MPLYIRNNVSWTPTSLKEESFELDDADFIQDPDLEKDVLPQPYRMINKLLWNIIDDVWEHVNERESERVADATRLRPPQYQCKPVSESDSPLNKADCLMATTDGQYIVLGLDTGLSVLQSDTGNTVDTWSEDQLHITSIQTASLADDKHVISTIDDMGQARLYALAADHLYHLCTVNDNSADNKIIVGSCKVSSGGDYLTVSMEKPSSQTRWLEVHRLPKEAWIKDLDSLIAKSAPKDTTQEETVTADGGDTTTRSNESSEDQQSLNPGAPGGERTSHKFTSTTIHCKVLPPPELTGSSGSVHQSSKAIDNNCDVIGMGAHHVISGPHLDQRHQAFKAKHEELMKYLPEDSTRTNNEPHYYYMQPGRLLPQGLTSSSGQPGFIVVWWQQCTQLLLYSLNKQAKELERRPDMVIPVASYIVSSDVSSDGTQLAITLDNNNLIVWDTYLGVPKGIKHICDEGHVMQVTLLDPDSCPQDKTEYPPYPVRTNYYAMITIDTGELYLVNCSHMTEPPISVDLCVMKEKEIPTFWQTVDGLPNLLLTCRKNSQIFLHDLRYGNQICEITLPSGYEPVTPWQPILCMGSKGRMLYVKGQREAPSEPSPGDEAADNGQEVSLADTSLFILELYTHLSLDKYVTSTEAKVPFVVHTTISQRVNALLKERISQQGNRVTRMQSRWTCFQDEIANIVKIQENAEKLKASCYEDEFDLIRSPTISDEKQFILANRPCMNCQ